MARPGKTIMTSTANKTWTALWVPGWYELDQPLETGKRNRFWFFQQPPSGIDEVEMYDFVFFNELNSAANCQVREATVLSIDHPQLGGLSGVATDGLDYRFVLADGTTLVVNAEEDPGTVAGDGPDVPCIDNWSVAVVLTDVSDPVDCDR
jgi:hypothetical protein